jgi:glutathione peroxidase
MKIPSTFLALAATLAFAMTSSFAEDSVHDFVVNDINGKEVKLADYKGKVLLIVNVASKCGNTKQYTELQALHETFKKNGLAILAFPCNDFGGQEPGTNEDIQEFCSSKYSVTFPLFDKVVVKGENKHPLYMALSGPDSPFPGDVKWNFGKFLVGKDGKILARFEPKTKPDAPEVLEAIKTALK